MQYVRVLVMTNTDPRECCWACEIDEYACRDLFCSCHDGIATLSGLTGMEN